MPDEEEARQLRADGKAEEAEAKFNELKAKREPLNAIQTEKTTREEQAKEFDAGLADLLDGIEPAEPVVEEAPTDPAAAPAAQTPPTTPEATPAAPVPVAAGFGTTVA